MMEDKNKNDEFFKKIGFEKDCEWMLHIESFCKFLSTLSEIITDENVLSDQEIMDYYELKQKQLFIEGDTLENKLSEIEQIYPGLHSDSDRFDDDIVILKIENDNLKQLKTEYSELIERSENTLSHIKGEITDLELSITDLENREKNIYSKCTDKIKEIEELQKENKILSDKLQECYENSHDPPLFIHQMDFEEYFIKNDLFLNNLSQFQCENFKFKNLGTDNENDDDNDDVVDAVYNNDGNGNDDDIDNDNDEDKIQNENYIRLLRCEKEILKYENELMKANMENIQITMLCETMNTDIIKANSLEEIEKQTNELQIANLHDETDILVDELKNLINKSIKQKIEIILYENTKEKYERAVNKFNILINLSKIVSDALINAEIIWVLMQIDLEKIINRFDYNEYLYMENHKCMKYIDRIQKFQQNNISLSVCDDSIEQISKVLAKYLKEIQCQQEQQQHIQKQKQDQDQDKEDCNLLSLSLPLTLNKFIEEYNKIFKSKQFDYNLIKIKKNYNQIFDFIHTLDEKYKILSELLFDGPTSAPLFESFELLEQIYDAKNMEIDISDKLRKLRSKYEDNVRRMENDKLWQYHQMLWIWFLTEPKKMIAAIADVKKIASKIPSPIINTLSGIKRNLN